VQIQIHTDNHIDCNARLIAWVESELGSKIDRFADHVTRIDVHLSERSGARTGDADKRCLLEVRPAGQAPTAVSHDAASVGDAVHGAADKLVRALETAFGRSRDAHGRDTIRGE
jgi:ribosome-associated translation inhibitor RaiA